MKKNMILAVAQVVLAWAAVGSLQAAEFYVSPRGGDDSPGTKEMPLATLEAARDAVRALPKKDESVTVWIGAGKYELAEPFVLNGKDSGMADNRVVWRAEERGTVHLIGGRELPSKIFRKLSDAAVKERLSAEAAKAVYVADLKAAGITDFGKHTQYGHALSVTESPLELFYNDKAMTLARYPNEGFMQIGKVVDRGSVPRGGDYSERGGCFEYTDERHVKWVGQKDVWLQGTFGNGYADDKILVESIDPATKQVKLAMPHMYGIKTGRNHLHYKALNILDALTKTPEGLLPDIGQAFGKQASGHLYGWSRDNSDSGRLRGRNRNVELDSMVHFQGDIVWEADVGLGRYEVTVVTGDSRYNCDNVTVSVEGIPLWKSEKLAANKFLTKTVEVEVSDGRLTIASANHAVSGAQVVRICSVQIKKLNQ